MALWRRLRPVEPDDANEPDDGVTLDLTDGGWPIVDVTHLDDPTPFDELLDVPAAPPAPFEPVVVDLNDVPERPEVFERNDAPDPEAPTATCGRCGSRGERDLMDVFTRTEYYSCADCGHMWQQQAD